MRKTKLILSLTMVMVFMFTAIPVSAEEPNTAIPVSIEGMDATVNPRSEIDLSTITPLNLDVSSQSYFEKTDLINTDEVISIKKANDFVAAAGAVALAGTANKYGWNNGTYSYDFTQKWSTNTEIFDTYPWYNYLGK